MYQKLKNQPRQSDFFLTSQTYNVYIGIIWSDITFKYAASKELLFYIGQHESSGVCPMFV